MGGFSPGDSLRTPKYFFDKIFDQKNSYDVQKDYVPGR